MEMLDHWIGYQKKLHGNRLHARMAEDIDNLHYTEGYRFEEVSGTIQLCSWCVDTMNFNYAIDSSVSNYHTQFGYVGIAFTPEILEEAQQGLSKTDELWILPQLLNNRLMLPPDGTVIFEP